MKKNIFILMLTVILFCAVNSRVGSNKTFASVKIDVESNRVQKNGFYKNNTYVVQVGKYEFTIPKYWEKDNNNTDGFRAYAETNGKVAMLNIYSHFDEDDPVSFESQK